MADPFIGRKTDVGIAVEGTRGTCETPDFWIPYGNLVFQERVDKVMSEQAVSHIAQHTTAVISDKYAEGELSGEVFTGPIGTLLLAVFGDVSSGVYATSAYEHEFSLDNTNLHDSLSIAYKDDVRDLCFKNAMLSNLQIEVTPGDIVRFTAGVQSLYPNDHSSWTTSYTSNEHRFRGRDLCFRIAATAADLDAASDISVKSFTLNFIQDLTRDNTCGTLGAEDIYNTIWRVEMEAVLNFQDETYLDYAHNNVQRAVRFELLNQDVSIGDGTGNPRLQIDFPKVGFNMWERSSELDDIVAQTLSMEAFYDLNTSKIVESCNLRNETATYA